MSLSRLSIPLVLATLAAAVGCGDKRTVIIEPPPGPKTGILDVRVVGLPSGTNATVNITGPNNFTFAVSTSTVINDVAPGTYTVTATKVTSAGDSFDPTPTTQQATVVASTVPTSVNVAYLVTTARLAVNVNGLPSTGNATVKVTGPNDFTRTITSSEELVGLAPGSYQIAADNAVIGGHTYAATPPNLTVVLSPSSTARQATVNYTLTTGSLDIALNAVPLGFTPTITIRRPDNTTFTTDRSQVYTGIATGDYTITAGPASDGQNTYAANPATTVVKVEASLIPTRVVINYAPSTGSLTVTLQNLPPGVSGAVAVTGPNAFTATVAASRTLTGLAPGTYTLTASAVGTTTLYTPQPETQTLTVQAGRTASALITYTGTPVVAATLRSLATGFSQARVITAPPNDSRLFVVEKRGVIKIFNGTQVLAAPFLDISPFVSSTVDLVDERGLLGLAFHPQYATNGFFFVLFSNLAGDIVLQRFSVSVNPNLALTTPTTVLTIPHAGNINNYGGALGFGSDGMLYIGIGDGGGIADPSNNGQSLTTLLGKLLRIDVSTLPYTVPPGNPFATGGNAPEIWAYGLRNPQRLTFDPFTAQFQITDNGERLFEEVNTSSQIGGGQNFGWNVMEGHSCATGTTCNTAGRAVPAYEFAHVAGCRIVGGPIYRGDAFAQASGKYLFGDSCTGVVSFVKLPATSTSSARDLGITVPGGLNAIGQGQFGEPFVIGFDGTLYTIEPATGTVRFRR
jgi:glucose/arabinose dehydrogenase